MSGVTRRALRVYVALSELRRPNGNEDVLDALIPFFEPILEVMNDRVFEPRVFAAGVQKLYRWRFTRDIAEQFIPRLQRKGLLENKGRGDDGPYVVRFKPPAAPAELPIQKVFESIVDEFEQFYPRITDLLHYSRKRDELADNLIRFLVSMDAYNETAFKLEVQRWQLDIDVPGMLDGFEEGSGALSDEDKYMCARFVQHVCKQHPDYVAHLSRIASIGLLTDVVEDFVKPLAPTQRSNLTVVVDAPLALDYLGCSGADLQSDVKSIFDALRSIGCSIVVFPVTCLEMQRNLRSMLAKPPHLRHGYTHDALIKKEVLLDYVQAVANDPEAALQRTNIQVKPIDLAQFPNQHGYFDNGRYEDFFGSVHWVKDVAPREHDAMCMTLLMRLRAGRHSSDMFKCGYVFVTRNSTFVRESRRYCLANRLIYETHQGPIVHQRQLATVAWLRTGLGANEVIPRAHMLAACDRVLGVRQELRQAVVSKLSEITPEKIPQLELLLQDQRSVRKLADETLNDAAVVTTENAEKLFEAMKSAAIAEEREQFSNTLKAERAKHRSTQKTLETENKATREALEEVQRTLASKTAAEEAAADQIAREVSWIAAWLERGAIAILLICALAAMVNYLTGWFATSWIWYAIATLAALYGLYSLIFTMLEKPRRGLATILDKFSRRQLNRKLLRARLADTFSEEDFAISVGRAVRKQGRKLPG